MFFKFGTEWRSKLNQVFNGVKQVAKVVWTHLPYVFQAGKVIGKALSATGIPIGSTITAGAEALQKGYEGINDFIGLTKPQDRGRPE